MQLEIPLTVEVIIRLIQGHGELKEKGSRSHRDCYQLQTKLGTYQVPASANLAVCPPDNGPAFLPAGQPWQRINPKTAMADEEIVALLNAATVRFTV